MTTALLTVGNFLIQILFSLMIFLLWLRIILRYFRISTLHPFGHTVYAITSPVLSPIEQLLYGKAKKPSRYDWVSFGAILLLELIKFILLALISYQRMLPLSYLILFILADLIINPCNLLFYALILRVLLSWVNTTWQRHPAAD